jgi:hypothetical protein
MCPTQCLLFARGTWRRGYLRLRLSSLALFTRPHYPEAVSVRPIAERLQAGRPSVLPRIAELANAGHGRLLQSF